MVSISRSRSIARFLQRSLKGGHLFATLALGLSSSALLGSALELRSINQENLAGPLNFVDPTFKGVGFINFPSQDGQQIHQSGFFLREDIFMTALPATETEEVDCDGMTIRAGSILLRGSGVRTFSCRRIREQNPRYGYMLIEVQGRSAQRLAVMPEDSDFSFWRDRSFHMLGYSNFGRMFFAGRCAAKPDECVDCGLVDIDQTAWMDGQCLNYFEMIGAPVFSREHGEPLVVGIYSALAPAITGTGAVQNQIKLVDFNRLRAVSPLLASANIDAPTCELIAVPEVVDQGDPATLTISVDGRVSGYSINGVDSAALAGGNRLVVRPIATTTFAGLVRGPGGVRVCRARVSVRPIPAPSCNLTASRSAITAGETTELTITTSGRVDRYSINGVSAAALASGDTLEVAPITTTTFAARVEGPGGVRSCRTTVTVTLPPAPTCTLTANPSTIEVGQTSRLVITPAGSWTDYEINGTDRDVLIAGNELEVSPTTTTTFPATITGLGGDGDCSVTVTVNPDP